MPNTDDRPSAPSRELVVARSALLEVGLPHIAAAVSERRRHDVPFPTLTGSGYRFRNGSMTDEEEVAVGRAFHLAHLVHDPGAVFEDGGNECPTCDGLSSGRADA